jgi:hypothetical protein
VNELKEGKEKVFPVVRRNTQPTGHEVGDRKELDWERLEEIMSPVDGVLRCDLAKLRRMDMSKRASLSNDVENNLTAFEEHLSPSLPHDLRQHYRSKFTLAQLLLVSASHLNSEENPRAASFNEKEIALIQDFEKYNVFDLLSVEEIVDRIARRDDLFLLVREVYEKHYADLDGLLAASEVQQDLKQAFKRKYEKRLYRMQEAVKAYVGKYGPVLMLRQIEEGVWQKVKESEQERERISAEARKRLEGLTLRLKPLQGMEDKAQSLNEKILAFQRNILGGTLPDLSPVVSEKKRLFDSFVELEEELSTHVQRVIQQREELDASKSEMERLAEEYRQQAEEEKERVIQSELSQIEKVRAELTSQEHSIQEQRESLEIKREDVGEKLRQLQEIAEGKPLRWVKSEDARLAEVNFIARFEHKMQKLPIKILHPVDNRNFVINTWGEECHLRTSESVGDPTLPSNESSQYVVTERRYKVFGERSPKVVIEAVSFNHLPEFQEYGFDMRRANTGEFLGLIARRIRKAELGKYLHIIGIASPTGWDEKVIKELSSDSFARNYVSQYVSVCLVDSITGEIYYNPADKRISDFTDRFKPEFEEEKFERLKKQVLGKLKTKRVVALDDLAGEIGDGRNMLPRVFYDLERQGDAKVRIVKDIGLVIEAQGIRIRR